MEIKVLESSVKPSSNHTGVVESVLIVEVDGLALSVLAFTNDARPPEEVAFRLRSLIMREIEKKLFNDFNYRTPE